MWLGSLQNPETISRMIELLPSQELGTKKDLTKLLDIYSRELPTSSFYDYHHIAKLLKVSPPDIGTVLERITAAGYPATRTHFSGYGIKTEAPLDVIFSAIRGPAD
jgi:tRNA (guanine26-N2/guanine27-N2)-dimethyltransferase